MSLSAVGWAPIGPYCVFHCVLDWCHESWIRWTKARWHHQVQDEGKSDTWTEQLKEKEVKGPESNLRESKEKFKLIKFTKEMSASGRKKDIFKHFRELQWGMTSCIKRLYRNFIKKSTDCYATKRLEYKLFCFVNKFVCFSMGSVLTICTLLYSKQYN